MSYKLTNQDMQNRINEIYEETGNYEIATVQYLTEQELNSPEPNPTRIEKYVALLAKTRAVAMQNSYRDSEVLAKPAIYKMARQISDLIGKGIANRFDGWEDFLEQLGKDIQETIKDTKNE